LPELLTAPQPLVLNLTTLADIYLGTVDRWDHAAIRELNPTLAYLLPAQNITVVLSTYDAPAITRIMAETLRNVSQTFRELVVL
jgi:ABC-type phosphate transport system substrate-binding protein